MAQRSSGHLAMRGLKQAGVDHLFTLSGGHIFPLYDGCRHEDVRLIDVRHEQAAAFAAEGMGKLTRRPGVAAVTAGPGVTNVMSAIAGARCNGSPMLGDGGDFVSFAGKHVPSHTPGCWMDPGPYGCLGTGTGYAMAARLARPDSQVVVLLGDGAAGFGLLDVDSATTFPW